MAEKWRRTLVGTVRKPKDPTDPVYLNLRGGEPAKRLAAALSKAGEKGINLNIESAEEQLAGVVKAVESGKMSEDLATTIKERISRIPTYVKFEITLAEKPGTFTE